MRPTDRFDDFPIPAVAVDRPDAAGDAPPLLTAPFLVEFVEPAILDPSRATAQKEAGDQRARPSRATERARIGGLVGSLLIHLLAVLALLDWDAAPSENPRPIPVQLVIEQPPAPPKPEPAKPQSQRPPPPGALASEDIGEPAPATSPTTGTETVPSQTGEAQVAAVPVPPALASPPEPDWAAQEQATTPPTDLPSETIPPLPVNPPAKQRVAARPPPNPYRPSPTPRMPGPAASRDEYLAYCAMLIRRHYDIVPVLLLAGRDGTAEYRIMVRADGTIAGVSVVQSSGTPDLDHRIEEMVEAVHRFPPLPQWYQGPSILLTYSVSFRDGRLR